MLLYWATVCSLAGARIQRNDRSPTTPPPLSLSIPLTHSLSPQDCFKVSARLGLTRYVLDGWGNGKLPVPLYHHHHYHHQHRLSPLCVPDERCLHRRNRGSDEPLCGPSLLVSSNPFSPRCIHTLLHKHQYQSECYAHIREYRGDFGTERLFTGPLTKFLRLHLHRAQSPSALRLRRCFLRSEGVADLTAKGRNSTVVAAYCLHVDVHITTMWRLLQSCCCFWWIFSLILPAFVLLWAECHPGKFHTPTSQTLGFIVVHVYGGMWLWLCHCQDDTQH